MFYQFSSVSKTSPPALKNSAKHTALMDLSDPIEMLTSPELDAMRRSREMEMQSDIHMIRDGMTKIERETGNDRERVKSKREAMARANREVEKGKSPTGSFAVTRKRARSETQASSIADKFKGGKIVDWYQAMFEKTTTFASILASVMFSAMILDLSSGKIPNGTEVEVRTWAASGALLFVILVLLCTGCSLGLKYHAGPVARLYANKNRLVSFGFALGSLLFQGLLLSGTMFFCLVVKAYAPAIGWTAFGITALCTLISFGVWAWELKGEILKQLNREKTRKQDAEELAAFTKGGSDVPPKKATPV